MIRLRRYRHHLFVLPGYLILTLAMTYPLVRVLGQAIPGDSFDGWQNVWNLWWIKRSLLVLGTSPYFTHEVYYPTGAPLYFQTLNIFNGLTFLPFSLATNLFVSYNVIVLFSFVMGGYGAYLLAYYILRGHTSTTWRPWAAFMAGVVYTFSPYHFAHLLGHMQLISLEWLPFYVLSLLQSLDRLANPPPFSSHNLSSPTLSLRSYISLAWKPALFLLLTALCDWYYAFYLICFTGLAVLWTMWKRRAFWPPLVTAGLIGVLFALPLSALLLTIVSETLTADYMLPPPGSNVELSADLLAFLSPNEFHPLWGEVARAWGAHFSASPSEHIVFAGYGVLLLSALAIACCWRQVRFWALNALVFLLLSLGPVLHIGGQTTFGWLKNIPMPYGLLNHMVPLLFLARSISRFDVMVMLFLGILAAYGLSRLLQFLTEGRAGKLMTVGVAMASVGLVCFEFLPAPYPISWPEIHPFHYQLAQDPDDYAVLDLPMDWDRPANMLYQTVHRKPLISAYTPDYKSRPNPLAITEKTPVLQHFRYLGPDIIAQDPAVVAPTILADLDVRYVLVHKSDLPPGDYREKTLALVESVFGQWPIVCEDDRLRVYEAQPPEERVPYIVLGNGWGPRQLREEKPLRTFTGQATFSITAPPKSQQAIVLEAQSPTGPQQLELRLNGRKVGEFALDSQAQRLTTGSLILLTGANNVELQAEHEILVYEIGLQKANLRPDT
jgi:hypothetical protein